MSDIQKALDILKDAIKAEIEDYTQYKLMSERIDDEETRDLCYGLSEEEKAHRKMLETHYTKISNGDECVIDNSELNLIKIPLGHKIDRVDLIKRSIEKEKAGNEYYSSMAKVVKDMPSKKLLQELANIEKKHEKQLTAILKKIK